jgi:hypothetical protein
MTERAYTVSEIEALRRAIDNKYLFGSYNPQLQSGTLMSRSYMADEKMNAVEQMVRTHMLAGHTAADLYASESPALPTELKHD